MVDLDDAYPEVLVQFHHISGMGNTSISHLGDVDEAVLMDTDIDKSTEVGNVGDDARQDHAFYQVIDGCDILVELKLLYLFTRVATGFLQFLHDVGKGGDTYLVSDIAADVDRLTFLFVCNQIGNRTTEVLRHLLHDCIALWVDGSVIEWILCPRNTQETGTLLEGGRSEARHFLELGS